MGPAHVIGPKCFWSVINLGMKRGKMRWMRLERRLKHGQTEKVAACWILLQEGWTFNDKSVIALHGLVWSGHILVRRWSHASSPSLAR